MRYLVVGDIHIKTSNIPQIAELSDFIVEQTLKTKPDAVVFLGDVLDYHEKVLTPCLNRAYTLIERVAELAPLYILVGNHDYISNMQFLTDNHWMNALKMWKNVTIVDRVIVENNTTFCPYVFPGRFTEALATCPGSSTSEIIFCHQEFRGCDMGAVKSEHGDEPGCVSSLVVSGHIHDNQQLSSNIRYVGAPLQHTFSEKEKRVLFLMDGTNIVEIPIGIGLKRSVPLAYIELDDFNDSQIEIGVDTRLIVSATVNECKAFKKTAKYKALIKRCKIVFRAVDAATTPSKKCEYMSFNDVCLNIISDSRNSERLADRFSTIIK